MSMTKWLELSAQSIALGIVGKHLIGTLFRYPLTYPKRVKNSLCFKKLSRNSPSLSLPFNGDPSAGGWRVARVAGTRRSHPASQCAVRSHPAICGQARSRMRFHLLSALSSTPLLLSPSLSRNLPIPLPQRLFSRSPADQHRLWDNPLNPGGAMKKETRLGRRSSTRLARLLYIQARSSAASATRLHVAPRLRML